VHVENRVFSFGTQYANEPQIRTKRVQVSSSKKHSLPGITANSADLPKNDIRIFSVGQKNIVAIVQRNPLFKIHFEDCLEVPG